MTTVCRFAALQMLMLWQGGFLFYAAVVVPAGTDVLGTSFEQGRITRVVTRSMNWIGLAALAVFALEILLTRASRNKKNWLWGSWMVMTLGAIWLFPIHDRLMELVDFKEAAFSDRRRFRFWHRSYLWICTFQWVAGLVFAWVLVRAWREQDRANSQGETKNATGF